MYEYILLNILVNKDINIIIIVFICNNFNNLMKKNINKKRI